MTAKPTNGQTASSVKNPQLRKESTNWIKKVIKQYGFPGYSLVEQEATQAALTMIQHADDLELQKQCLELLRQAVEQKEIFHLSAAHLIDRIRVAEKKPQLHSTQIDRTPDGNFTIPAIEDEANVDKRRAAIGLPPLADYIEEMKKRRAKQKPNN